jgi:hypothetical protein
VRAKTNNNRQRYLHEDLAVHGKSPYAVGQGGVFLGACVAADADCDCKITANTTCGG